MKTVVIFGDGITSVTPTAATGAYMSTDTIRNGVTERIAIGQPPVNTGGPFNNTSVNSAVTAQAGTRKGGKNEIVLYQNVAMLSGKQAGNPWLLELPDPITRATWDNYAMISTAKAKELGIDYKNTDYEYYTEKPLIELTVNGKKITLPALVVPGMEANTIAVALGYGRSGNFAKAVEGVGQNVYQFARLNILLQRSNILMRLRFLIKQLAIIRSRRFRNMIPMKEERKF